jgi:hypothetical protein
MAYIHVIAFPFDVVVVRVSQHVHEHFLPQIYSLMMYSSLILYALWLILVWLHYAISDRHQIDHIRHPIRHQAISMTSTVSDVVISLARKEESVNLL